MDLIRDLKNELIQNCLFATPDPFSPDPLAILTAPKRPPIPKCHTSLSRQAAFNLLLECSKNNHQIWNEILMDLQEMHDKRMNDIGSSVCCILNNYISYRLFILLIDRIWFRSIMVS